MNNKKIIYEINFITKDNEKEFKNYIKNIDKLKEINYHINDKKISNKIKVEYNKSFKFEINKKTYNNLEELLEKELILPQLFLNNLNIDEYTKKLVSLEHKKTETYNIEKQKLNKIIKKNLDVFNGIDDVYEWNTGAVYFKDYEWEELEETDLKKLFKTKQDDYYIYSLPINNGIMLRGSSVYYYFCSDVTRFRKPNIDEIKKWYSNITIFIKKLLKALKQYQIKDAYSKRLLLAVIDNLRNIILLLTNVELMLLSNNGKDFIYFENYHEKTIDDYFELITKYQKIIHKICIENDDSNLVEETIDICSKILLLKGATLEKTSNITDSFLLGKCYNLLREIDNYFENYIVCKYLVTKNTFKRKTINLIGILYGGLELPFITRKIYKKINIGFAFQNLGMYLDKQNKDRTIIDSKLIEYGKINKKTNTFLIDDNMMSGVTMQFNYNKLYVNNFKNIKGILIIRHPNLNRIGQTEYFDTAVNINLIDNLILGMVTDTPYTKIKRNTNHNNEFVNELGMFSNSTETFLKALYCNNSFIKDSQVDIFKGYSTGREK